MIEHVPVDVERDMAQQDLDIVHPRIIVDLIWKRQEPVDIPVECNRNVEDAMGDHPQYWTTSCFSVLATVKAISNILTK